MIANSTILVVDDEQDFLDLINAKLSAKGFKIACVKSGEEAIIKAKELQPAVILMDVKMPKKDGVETTLDLLADPTTKNIPVIFLTSLGDEHFTEVNRRLSKQIGAVDFFKKGGDYENLVAKLRSLLAK